MGNEEEVHFKKLSLNDIGYSNVLHKNLPNAEQNGSKIEGNQTLCAKPAKQKGTNQTGGKGSERLGESAGAGASGFQKTKTNQADRAKTAIKKQQVKKTPKIKPKSQPKKSTNSMKYQMMSSVFEHKTQSSGGSSG